VKLGAIKLREAVPFRGRMVERIDTGAMGASLETQAAGVVVDGVTLVPWTLIRWGELADAAPRDPAPSPPPAIASAKVGKPKR
jgi:hypothetical protein